MSTTPRRLWVALPSLAFFLACTEASLSFGDELSFTLTADKATATIGEEVTFNYSATGAVLTSILMDYGDATADTLDTAGAQSASGRFVHSFYAPGRFAVEGTVFDNLLGPAADQVVVEVVAGAGPT